MGTKEAVRLIFYIYFYLTTVTLAHHTYCTNDAGTSSSAKVSFTWSLGPARVGHGCTNQMVDMVCCMTGYTWIQWFQFKDNRWEEFSSVSYERTFYENNQTASLDRAWPARDEGLYKCVGYGVTPNDSISNTIKLNVTDCIDFKHAPDPLYPPDALTVLHRNETENATVRCEGFYGNLRQCTNCSIGWYRRIHSVNTSIGGNARERLYVVNEHALYDNSLKSTLHISEIVSSDYKAEFVCWMWSPHGPTNPARQLRIEPRHYVTIKSNVYKNLLLLVGVLVSLFVFVCVAVWRLRLDIGLQVRVNDWRRKPPSEEGLDYDVVLAFAHCDEPQSFGNRISQELKQHQYKVFHWPSDVHAGINVNDEFFAKVRKSRCVVFVLCADFLRDENCFFCLANYVQQDQRVNIIFIVYGEITSEAVDAYVKASLRISGRKIVWPAPVFDNCVASLEADANSELSVNHVWNEFESNHGRAVTAFYNRLRLAIPNQRNVNDSHIELRAVLASYVISRDAASA